MCEKKCDHHDDKKEVYRRILWGVIGIIVIILVVIFLVWVILQPQKPKFILQDATVNALSFSTGTNLLTSNLQLTLSTKNPNERIGIYYEKLDIYGSYRNQQITLATQLPRSYEGHKDITVWSPFLYGNSVPVSPYLGSALSQDLNAGAVLVNIKVDGTLKWKVGSWISRRYRINVNCPAYITFGHGVGIKYQFVLDCSVEVAPS
ncbi:NDR1/HIN1-like protein 1 [Mercurialis annua]|uniref:NDR1/HIN1-like protein 1 n=1 Tax=Mercurialis annua TaxID=3986 RepID=UPI00215F0836|nr:NDR1/HIN1-like protein 1 [Mercurialis annua]